MLQPTHRAHTTAGGSPLLARRERRAARRMPMSRELELTILAEDSTPTQRVQVRAMDISRTGMGVVTRIVLRPGTRGIVPLTQRNGQRALMGVEVMHAHVAGDGISAQGCAAGLRFFKLPKAVARRARL